MKAILIFFLVTLLLHNVSQGDTWLEPAQIIVKEGTRKAVFIRIDNETKIMEVRRARDLTEMWSVHVDDYDLRFSRVELSEGSEYLIHIFGNHMIESLEQDCIQIFTKDGMLISYRLNDFFDNLDDIEYTKLHPGSNKSDYYPKYDWFKRLNHVTIDMLGILLSDDRETIVSLTEKRIVRSFKRKK